MAAVITATTGGNIKVESTNLTIVEDKYFTPIELDVRLETFSSGKVIRFFVTDPTIIKPMVVEVSDQPDLPGYGNTAFGLINPDAIKSTFDALADACGGSTQAQIADEIDASIDINTLVTQVTNTATSLTNVNEKIANVVVLADSVANPARSSLGAFLQVFNGTTWDRLRSGITGAVSSVLGYLNVIPVGRYNATPPTLTDGQFINPQLDINGRTLTGAGLAYRSTATGTRAANTTAYTANDVYGGVVELPSIGSAGGFIILNQLRVMFNLSAVPSGMRNFTVYLYDAAPPSAVADNGAFSIPAGDRASLLTPAGLSGVATLAQGGGSVIMQIADINRVIKLANGSTSLWAYIVTAAAFTPAAPSETFTATALALGV